jgi:hypothetical protein
MARLRGDNGKPDDTAIKDILSPYDADRSALADCTKLATAQFTCRKAVVIYGFDYSDRLLDPMIDAFELLAARRVQLSIREVAIFGPLVHPVHAAGRVFRVGGEAEHCGHDVTLGRLRLPSPVLAHALAGPSQPSAGPSRSRRLRPARRFCVAGFRRGAAGW